MALTEGVNSYGNRTEADTYFKSSMDNDAWVAFSTAKRDQGLVQATRILERQIWNGTKEVSSQDLHFPAEGIIDCSGESLTADQSLEVMQEAQYEYALALLTDPALLTNREATGSNLKKVEAGSAKVTYFKSKVGTRFPLSVTELIKCFLLGSSSGGALVSGATDESSFTDPDKYNLNRGFS